MISDDDLRTSAQNERMWAKLGDISKQVKWSVNGYLDYMSPGDWKDVFTSSLTKQQRVAQGLEGGWVLLGERTRQYSKARMSELIELIQLFGDSKGVVWSEDNRGLGRVT